MKEILPDIFAWSRFSEPHGYDFNGHLLRHPEGNLCIDPVEPSDAELDEIARLGVAHILLTNRNHVRAANKVRERTGARTAIHPEDAAYARGQGAELDDPMVIGDKIGPLEVFDASGKSPGEVALYWPQRRILILGDAVIGNPPGALSLLPEEKMDDPAYLHASLRLLLDLDFDTLLLGDGVSILEGAKDKLRALVDAFPEVKAATPLPQPTHMD